MKKIAHYIIIISLSIQTTDCFSQSSIVDSMSIVIKKIPDDTSKVNKLLKFCDTLWQLGFNKESKQFSIQALNISKINGFKTGIEVSYKWLALMYQLEYDFTNAKKYLDSALTLALELKNKDMEASLYSNYGSISNWEDKYAESLSYHYKALKLYEEMNSSVGLGNTYMEIGYIYYNQGQYAEALKNHLASLAELRKTNDTLYEAYALKNVGDVFLKLSNYEKAIQNLKSAQKTFESSKLKPIQSWYAATLTSLGNVYEKLGELNENDGNKDSATKNYKEAFNYYKEASPINEIIHFNEYESELNLGNIYTRLHNYDEADKHLRQSLLFHPTRDAFLGLSKLDSTRGDYKQAYLNYKMYILYRDSLLNEEGIRKTTQEKLQYEFDRKESLAKAQQEIKDAQIKRTRNIQYTVIAAVLLLAIFLFWNNRQKQKANIKIEQAYSELKSTQQQLIQSEKMASLGELTAGIAHEIQNPLNFVNNFSEVSTELVDEMNEEMNKDNLKDAKEIANELKQNLEKINHHGKRADAIVKNMLQHSRTASGKKEPTDINKLVDEYLRLSYHGIKAKDKSFNAAFETNFDSTLPKLNVIPQDIGRVLLNIINNAFYAVNEKKKSAGLSATSYEPLITVQTKKINDKVEVIVTDNGNGIPQNIIDKIFQPFFTTKPTGQGTGLGLSLAYDIVKAHGGEIKVATKEGEGTTFIIQLPAG